MDQSISKRLCPVAPEVIPDEVLLFKILVHLPVKSLVRFKSVCKAWHATIASAHFVRLHLELARACSPGSVVLVPRKWQPEPTKVASRFVYIYSFQQPPVQVAKLIMKTKPPCPTGCIPRFTIPLHCDGLILIPSVTGHIFVCNPATKEFVELPPGTPNALLDQRVAFGFDPSSGTYKVARHFLRSYSEEQIDTEYDTGHEVLTLGDGRETLEWKATIDPPYPIKGRTPICLPGFFYWSAVQSVADQGKLDTDVILRFSMCDGTFTVHPNPPCSSCLSPNDLMCELGGGKLCYVHSPSPLQVSIWLAQDVQNIITWSLRCRVNLPIPRSVRVFARASADKDMVFLAVDAQNLFKCNLRDGSLETVVDMRYGLKYNRGEGVNFIHDELPFLHYMVPYVESLLRIGPCYQS
ncbi:hypothetical protein HU200_006870 [Digitaria exilis]|uniref:F-box domain-containing protein n=1 Tax=Digitaria exilis TaxID=1010633 RepID=A0A835FQY1_9POAL|nr:hypothetical protein HU200_006870 [Digitaria exilis]